MSKLWLKSYSMDAAYTHLLKVNGGNTSSQSFLSVVSTFENGKSSENRALCELVKNLGLKGKTFTMDALHTQKTLYLILFLGCHFLVQVKVNCHKLRILNTHN